MEETSNELTDSVPTDLRYDGKTVTFYVRNDLSFAEFNVEEANGDIIDDAVYNRNQTVSERLGVNFEFIEGPGAWGGRKEFAQNVSTSILAGDGAYDIVAGYSMAVASLGADGYLYELNDTKYLDFSKPWWSDSLLKQATINGNLYVASGDIATSLLYYMYGMFFNKQILEDFKLDDPYELALSGKWTLDKMIEMSTGVYSDLNGDGLKSSADRIGCEVYNVYLDPFYHAAGLRVTNIGSDGLPVASKDLSSEKAVDLYEKLRSFLFDTDDGYVSVEGTEPNDNFKYGRILFSPHELAFAASKLRDVKFDYGILPMPKYDENQENYITITSFPYSLYGIPKDAKDHDMSSAVMELLGAEGYKTVSPALFEIALKVKYSSDDNAAKIYDIIKGSISYDFGRVFTDSIDGSLCMEFRAMLQRNKSGWASDMASLIPAFEAGLEKLLEKFK